MKKILTLLTLVLMALTATAQVYRFDALGYDGKTYHEVDSLGNKIENGNVIALHTGDLIAVEDTLDSYDGFLTPSERYVRVKLEGKLYTVNANDLVFAKENPETTIDIVKPLTKEKNIMLLGGTWNQHGLLGHFFFSAWPIWILLLMGIAIVTLLSAGRLAGRKQKEGVNPMYDLTLQISAVLLTLDFVFATIYLLMMGTDVAVYLHCEEETVLSLMLALVPFFIMYMVHSLILPVLHRREGQGFKRNALFIVAIALAAFDIIAIVALYINMLVGCVTASKEGFIAIVSMSFLLAGIDFSAIKLYKRFNKKVAEPVPAEAENAIEEQEPEAETTTGEEANN